MSKDAINRLEYGVFIDRREAGLGCTLMHTCDDIEAAERMVDTIPERMKPFIQERYLTQFPWQPVIRKEV